jgi:hypothetical protein
VRFVRARHRRARASSGPTPRRARSARRARVRGGSPAGSARARRRGRTFDRSRVLACQPGGSRFPSPATGGNQSDGVDRRRWSRTGRARGPDAEARNFYRRVPSGSPSAGAGVHSRTASSARSRSGSGAAGHTSLTPTRGRRGLVGRDVETGERGPAGPQVRVRLMGSARTSVPGLRTGVNGARTPVRPTALTERPFPPGTSSGPTFDAGERAFLRTSATSTQGRRHRLPRRQRRTRVRGVAGAMRGHAPRLLEGRRSLDERPSGLEPGQSRRPADRDVLRPSILLVRRTPKPVQESTCDNWLCRASRSGRQVTNDRQTAQPCALESFVYKLGATDGRSRIWYMVVLCTLCNFSHLFITNSIDE